MFLSQTEIEINIFILFCLSFSCFEGVDSEECDI